MIILIVILLLIIWALVYGITRYRISRNNKKYSEDVLRQVKEGMENLKKNLRQ